MDVCLCPLCVCVFTCCRRALAVSDFRVYIHRPAGDGLPTDVAGGFVFS